MYCFITLLSFSSQKISHHKHHNTLLEKPKDVSEVKTSEKTSYHRYVHYVRHMKMHLLEQIQESLVCLPLRVPFLVHTVCREYSSQYGL